MTSTPALQESALEKAGAIVTETSLKFSDPRKLTWDHYVDVGHFLGSLGRAYPWWVGDFLNDGEDIFGEEFAQIEAMLPHSPQTCTNYKSIARHIPRERRRGLHLTVAAEVAYFPPKEREALLEQAALNGWKREEMRAAARELRELDPVDDLVVTGTADIEVTPGEPVPGPEHRCPACGHVFIEEG